MYRFTEYYVTRWLHGKIYSIVAVYNLWKIKLFSPPPTKSPPPKENRIYVRGEFRKSLGMKFFSLFQPEREFKVYKSCKCSQIICRRIH